MKRTTRNLLKTPVAKHLLKCIEVLHDGQYPGYPFSLNVIVDLKNQVVLLDGFESSLEEIFAMLLYQVLGCEDTEKGDFLHETHLESVEHYLNIKHDDLYIDCVAAARFYFALNSALRQCHKDGKGIVFAVLEGESEWVDVKIFYEDKPEEAEKYCKEYYLGEEEN